MSEYLPSLNEHNLLYSDNIHPIVVRFVIAMVIFAIFCNVMEYLTRNSRLYEVSSWNMFFATISTFIAVIFGQVEAGLSEPYNAVRAARVHWYAAAVDAAGAIVPFEVTTTKENLGVMPRHCSGTL